MTSHLFKLPTELLENVYKIVHTSNLVNVFKEMNETYIYSYDNPYVSNRIVKKKFQIDHNWLDVPNPNYPIDIRINTQLLNETFIISYRS